MHHGKKGDIPAIDGFEELVRASRGRWAREARCAFYSKALGGRERWGRSISLPSDVRYSCSCHDSGLQVGNTSGNAFKPPLAVHLESEQLAGVVGGHRREK